MFYIFIYQCMPATILHKGLCPTVVHLVYTIVTRGGCSGDISNYPPSILQSHLSTRDDI